jgi:acyl-CoA thioesterase
VTKFARATAVQALGDDRFAATVDDRWRTPAGPNGGYVAAIVLRALEAAAGRPARSVTLHYLRSPLPGDAIVEVRRRREGRTLTTLTASLVQEGRPAVLAIAALAGPYPRAVEFAAPGLPVAPYDEAAPYTDFPADFPFMGFLEHRPALGATPFTSSTEEAVTGGWLALREPAPLDAPTLALYADAWWPASFARMDRPSAAPTIDLTLHFRATPPPGADGAVAVRFTSRTAHDGYVEEDGEVWSADGTLLVQSRQLALLLAPA